MERNKRSLRRTGQRKLIEECGPGVGIESETEFIAL
jgi:hypothetical protein